MEALVPVLLTVLGMTTPTAPTAPTAPTVPSPGQLPLPFDPARRAPGHPPGRAGPEARREAGQAAQARAAGLSGAGGTLSRPAPRTRPPPARLGTARSRPPTCPRSVVCRWSLD